MKRLLFALGVLALLLSGTVLADQTITGGKDAGGNLILKSTTHPTKGYVGVDGKLLSSELLTGTVIVTSPTLAIGSTPANVSNAAFSYRVSGTPYTKAVNAAGTAPGNDVIPEDKYGAVAFDIGSDGTIDVIEAAANATGYDSAALAIAGIPDAAAGHVRMGTVTAMKSDGAFTFGSTSLSAANTTVSYSSTPSLDFAAITPTTDGVEAQTQPAADNSNKLATTSYVDTALAGKASLPEASANCVMGYNSSLVYGCWTSWPVADVGNILMDGALAEDGDVTIGTADNKFGYRSGGTNYYPFRRGVDTATEEVVIEINGNGSAVTTGAKAERFFAHETTISSWALLADQAGTCEIELWKDTLTNYPPASNDKITASMPVVLGSVYSKSAVAAGTAPGNDVIPQSKFGAVAFDIGSDGTIDAIEATGNATGYDSAALAVAGLPAAASGHVRMGTVTATKSDGAFTFGTTALNAANTTVAYTSSAITAKGIISSPTLAIGTTTTAVSNAAFSYYIGETDKGSSASLTGWTTAISANDTLRVNVDYCDTATRLTLILKVESVK